MDYKQLQNFVERIQNFSAITNIRQTDYFAFFLAGKENSGEFTVKEIIKCFSILSLKPYKRLATYLSENAGKKKGKYIKTTLGYKLVKGAFDNIKNELDNDTKKNQVSGKLIDIINKIKNKQEKTFALEALNCYSIGAYRAAIVMIWILTMDHIQKYIFSKKLTEFNDSLLKNPDKKIKKINQYDDFSDLSESKIIELMRASNIISNDVKKILEEKLGIRNSSAHPSGIIITDYKATEFALDLINNIIIKY